jgi:hypothetical protein
MRTFCFIGLSMLMPCLAQDVPKFEGTTIPVPPEQSQPWSASQSTLPPEVVRAMTDLFKVGLSDPRRCEYREIEVVVGSCWGSSWVMKTHGWVLPSQDKQKFAICWSGLVYPVVSVGAAADLHADVLAMLKKDRAQIDEERARFDQSEKQREDAARRDGKEYHRTDWPLRWNMNVASEETSVATDSMRPVKAALLFRLGQTELAEKVWLQWSGVTPQAWARHPHVQLAGDWVWALFDRAVCAHMRGDDHLALADAQALSPLQASATSAAGQSNNIALQTEPNLAYLSALPDLIADEERRIQEPAYTPVLQMANPPQGPDRIAGLIRDLELVSEAQHSQPGGVALVYSPIVQALINEGGPAVEPLLTCLEKDTRLTRSVQFGRDFIPSRNVLGVDEAAYAALVAILQRNTFRSNSMGESLDAGGPEGRKELADKMRAYWHQYGALTPEERWYETLNDAKATPAQWMEAAANMVQDSDVEVVASSVAGGGWITNPTRQPGGVPPMLEEWLRAKSNPSVSDLLLRRMKDLSAPTGQVYDTNLQAKTALALALAKWDGPAHFDALREMIEILKKRVGFPHESVESEITPIVRVYQARVTAGDPNALPEYAAWLTTLHRDDLDFATSTIFEIMWRHPNDSAIRQTAEKLFASKDSPWVPLLIKPNSFALSLMNSPMVGLAAFRTELLHGLTDKSLAGSVALDANSYINVRGDGGWGTSGGSYFLDSSAPAAGTIMPFRACDLYAFEISQLEGAPKYQLYWPLEKRDETIPILAQFLQRYGNLYQYQPQDSDEHDIFNKARIHFPKLDHPATQDDVDQNRAIFSLIGQSRLWQMPTFPMKASWTTLKDDPEQGVQLDGKKVVVYHTEGRIFQAEEVLVNGKWERFFGFVGLHHIAKAPASEIEFPSQGRFGPLAKGFDAELLGPGQSQIVGRTTISQLALKDALTVILKIRNRSGLDQVVPGAILQDPSDAKRLPRSVELTLGYSDKSFTNAYAIPDAEWQLVPLKKDIAIAESQAAGPTLVPTDEVTIMTSDLRDFFDVRRPGTYRVQASFRDPGGVTGKTNPATFTITGS